MLLLRYTFFLFTHLFYFEFSENRAADKQLQRNAGSNACLIDMSGFCILTQFRLLSLREQKWEKRLIDSNLKTKYAYLRLESKTQN